MKGTIEISAKCSDLFSATVTTDKGEFDYSCYVPEFFPEEHYGDYVQLKIDLETGRILNWKTPTQADFEKMKEEGGE